MDKKRVVSFILSLLMLLGTFANPVFAISSNPSKGEEVNFEIQEIDGKTYKVYKVSDLGLKNPEKLLTPKYRTRAAGDPMEDWVKVKLQSNTVGLTLGGDFNVEVYVALRKDSTKIAVAKINPTEERIEDQIFHFVKTDAYDENNPDHQDPDKWYLYVEDDFKYDIRFKYGERGNFGSENMLMIINQRAMPLYKAVWFTNNQQRPVVDAIYNDGDNIANAVKLNTTDFAENEYKSFSSEKMPLYVNQKEVIVKEENLGSVDKEKFLVSDMKGAVLWKLLIDQNGEKKTQGFVKDGDTKYHFNITGDYKTPFVATMREELKVKFDPNGATFDSAVKTEQAIGHSMKIGEAFGDLQAVTVPTKDQISNISQKDNKDQEFVGWVVDEADKGLDFSKEENKDKLVEPNGYVVKDNVTFYAVYAPVAQGRVAIQYVDASGTAILDKYKIKDEKYPDHAEGNKGKPVEASKIKEPKFIGYKRTADTIADAVKDKTYNTDKIQTVEVKYEKLPNIIPEDEASDDVKNTYTKVTFAADAAKGKLKLGDADGGAQKVYYVNPVEGKTIADVKAKGNITAEGKKDVYKVDDTTPWTFIPGEIDRLDTVITTVPVTVNANFVKEKGTVTYEFISEPAGQTLPEGVTSQKPGDKEYDVKTEVTAEPATFDPVPVKETREGKEVTVGTWNFKGWKVGEEVKNKLSVLKNGPNKFTGVWEFKKAGEEKVTYKFESKDKTKTLPKEVTDLLTKKAEDKFVGEIVKAPTDTYDSKEVKETINGKEVVTGKWTFDSWSPESLTVKENATNEFVGTWNFTESDKGHLVYNFTSEDGTLPDAVKNLKPTDNKENYVGVKVTPDDLTQKSVVAKNGDKEGTWSTTWTPTDVTLAKGENVVEVKWTFKEADKYGVTYEFKSADASKTLPSDITDQKPSDSETYYVGHNVEVKTKTFTDVNQEIDGKQGTWKFNPGWDKESKAMVKDGITFTGTWTWTEKGKITVKYVFDTNPDTKTLPAALNELKPENLEGEKAVYPENAPSKPDAPATTSFDVVEDGKKVGTWEAGSWSEAVKDDKGNITYTLTWTFTEVGKSKTPDVNPVKPGDKKITGKGEPGSDIEVTIPGQDEPIKTTVDENGDWTVKVPEDKELKDGDKVIVTQTEKDKKTSDPVERTVTADKKPEPRPSAPAITWRGLWFLGDSKSEPVQEMETGRHYKYLYGYVDKTVRPEGMITRSEAAALIARLANLDMSDKTKPNFKDTPSAWYNSAINAMVSRNLMFADKNGNFRPNEPITRGEFARALYYIDKKNDKVAPFADVKGHEFEEAINQAYGNGRIAGYPDGTFKPDAKIQRAEAARILNQYADRNVTLAGMANVKNDLVRFTDINESHWAYCEVMEAANSHEYQRAKGTLAETWLKILDK